MVRVSVGRGRLLVVVHLVVVRHVEVVMIVAGE